jgi:hypothetical protein
MGTYMSRKLLIILVVLLVLILGANFFTPDESPDVAHTNSVDWKLSTYSDRNITYNAKVTSPQFGHLAFEETRDGHIPPQLASVFRALKYFFKTPDTTDKEYGTWLWTPTLSITPAYTKEILDRAKSDGVNTVYLSIDSYLDIFVMRNGVAKESRRKEFAKILDNFLTEAHARDIEVDAEAGWRNWGEPGNEYKPLAILQFVKEFNDSHDNKFRGFQYDIEPYMLDHYDANEERILKNFVTLVDRTENFIGSDDLKLSVVVPAFYDERDRSIPKFDYKGSNASVLKHLLNILDRRSGSSILVMSYRNFARGNDGSIDISSNELRTAKKGRYSTEIILAQETGNFPPAYITFYGKTRKYFEDETGKLSKAFSKNANFGGLAIHYANSMSELK